jgi:hypothetical protein
MPVPGSSSRGQSWLDSRTTTTTSNFPCSPTNAAESGADAEHYISTKSPGIGTSSSRQQLHSSVGSLGGGALRYGAAPTLWSRECVGLFAQYAAVGLLYGALPGTIYPLLQNYLNVQGTQALAARVLVSLPWSFKVFYGIVSDCFPVGGYRRRPYMLLGWAISFAVLVAMACTSVGEPYYTDPSV